MLNVLVTGGAGYIGSHCCKVLHRQGYHPVTIDNLVYGHRENVKWGDFVKGDIGCGQDLKQLFDQFKIAAVMHFAAYAYVGESVTNPIKYYENNVGNTIQLLKYVVKHQVKYFVFSSSCATYGNPESVPIEEEHPRNPINPYGNTKRIIEDILKDLHSAHGLRSTSLRYFNAAGADHDAEIGELHQPETHLIPLVLDVAAGKTRDIKVFGDDYPTPDGTCIRDYIHVNDLAQAHVLALQKLMDTDGASAFNLGVGKGYSVMEVIERAKKITGKDIAVDTIERRPGDPPELVAANKKAMQYLGWQPCHSDLDEIIETAWNWHMKVD
jgi:UDP-glucose 4-epimerase